MALGPIIYLSVCLVAGIVLSVVIYKNGKNNRDL